jgi:hypothetical protein
LQLGFALGSLEQSEEGFVYFPDATAQFIMAGHNEGYRSVAYFVNWYVPRAQPFGYQASQEDEDEDDWLMICLQGDLWSQS